ncbi:UNVERIFIED_CONTAM: hypothetical protein K2H54_056771 [Gekko kuhli]
MYIDVIVTSFVCVKENLTDKVNILPHQILLLRACLALTHQHNPQRIQAGSELCLLGKEMNADGPSENRQDYTARKRAMSEPKSCAKERKSSETSKHAKTTSCTQTEPIRPAAALLDESRRISTKYKNGLCCPNLQTEPPETARQSGDEQIRHIQAWFALEPDAGTADW